MLTYEMRMLTKDHYMPTGAQCRVKPSENTALLEDSWGYGRCLRQEDLN
jgi:hypothetical protein